MSIQNASGLETSASTTDRTEFDHYVLVDVTDEVCNVANLEHGEENAAEHTYTVFHENGLTTRCTCPADKYHPGKCKHRKAVESVKDDSAALEGDRRVSGPHVGYDCYGNRDHVYWRCEECGDEATDKDALSWNCKCARREAGRL